MVQGAVRKLTLSDPVLTIIVRGGSIFNFRWCTASIGLGPES